MKTTRHEFLASLHNMIRPQRYLEIGVQHGTSLDLARPETRAFGVDPNPLCQRPGLFRMTSDQFFADPELTQRVTPVDFGFIDGMHLVEFALRDFMGLERLCRRPLWTVGESGVPTRVHQSPSIIVFDDVLPRNQAEARREQCPGDWTGDVWRIDEILTKFRPDLDLILVDTEPTGLLVVTNLNPDNAQLDWFAEDIATRWPAENQTVPDHVLNRTHAWHPRGALDGISDWWRIVAAQSTPQQEVTP